MGLETVTLYLDLHYLESTIAGDEYRLSYSSSFQLSLHHMEAKKYEIKIKSFSTQAAQSRTQMYQI